MEKSETQKIVHPLRPVYDAGSRVLILGTMPSPKSRENGFYYTHPHNRFWRVLAGILGEDTPADNAGREALAREYARLKAMVADGRQMEEDSDA